jgi:hypothetical protein
LGLADGVLLVLQESEHVVNDGGVVDRLVSAQLGVHDPEKKTESW